ncbi:MAG: response regulator [Caldilineaceae bacterium]|nr:response regulator [Caldilineaceae bacterium]
MDTQNQKITPSILVVDDYVVTLRVVSTQLRKGGYEVTTASSGQEALQALAQRSFDLAIIDVAMPEMDGITLLEKLRQESKLIQLPVIMLTASVLDEDRVRAQAAGATDFLTKPISSWELLEVVKRHLTHFA